MFGEASEDSAIAALAEYELSDIPPCPRRGTSDAVTRELSLFGRMTERTTLELPSVVPLSLDDVSGSDLFRGLHHLPSPIDARAMSAFVHPFFMKVATRTGDAGEAYVDFIVIALPDSPDNVNDTEETGSELPRAIQRVMRVLEGDIASLLSEEILHSLRFKCVSVVEPVEEGAATMPDTSATEGFATDASAGLVARQPFRDQNSQVPLHRGLHAYIDRKTLDLVLHHLRRVHKRSVSAFTVRLFLLSNSRTNPRCRFR
jgi:hypothetical protein